VRVVLAGTEVILVYLGIEVLAGELKGIIHRLFKVGSRIEFSEGIVDVAVFDVAGGVYNLADAAEAVVQVEVSVCCVVAGVLGDYLAISVNISLHDISAII